MWLYRYCDLYNYNLVCISTGMRKKQINQVKHRVSFELCQLVFDDPHQVCIQHRHENGEERWQTIGIVGGTVVLLIAHTYQDKASGEAIRIISARKATRHERQHYEKCIG